jgi:hypothetical protein
MRIVLVSGHHKHPGAGRCTHAIRRVLDLAAGSVPRSLGIDQNPVKIEEHGV